MVDRILHVGFKLAPAYDKELVHRAAQTYIYKSRKAVVPYLVEIEKMKAVDADVLFQKLDAEMQKINRQVLLQYCVIAAIFIVLVIVGLTSQSYIFAGLFALPALRLIYSTLRFIRRNPLR